MLNLGLFRKESVAFAATRFISTAENMRSYANSCMLLDGSSLKGPDNDITAGRLHTWAVENLKYGTDILNWGAKEHYLFPEEAFICSCKGKGMDCEDGAHLIVSFGYCLGIPSSRLQARACEVRYPDGTMQLHIYAAYQRTTDDEWVALDWCFMPDNAAAVTERTPVRLRGEYWPPMYYYTDTECWTAQELTFTTKLSRTRV